MYVNIKSCQKGNNNLINIIQLIYIYICIYIYTYIYIYIYIYKYMYVYIYIYIYQYYLTNLKIQIRMSIMFTYMIQNNNSQLLVSSPMIIIKFYHILQL